jgi:predicted transcriptional regulator
MDPARRRRSRSSVIVDILNEALTGVNKTRIMYRCNLNCQRFNRYLVELLQGGLIKCSSIYPDGMIVYRTTERGRELLKVLQRASEFLST